MRFSPKYFEQMIEYEVELNAIPISSINQGKDIIVNWRLFNGFDPKGKFWTDSNSLMMIERNINQREQWKFNITNSLIASNYYPVDSAIAMRDFNGSNLQVTVMNDRAQGGSADLNSKASIELMQHRRITEDDNKGAIEPLNETDSSGVGIKATATYYMQIFDYQHHRSLQRDYQEAITNPIQYFFAFKGKQSATYKPSPDYQASSHSPYVFL